MRKLPQHWLLLGTILKYSLTKACAAFGHSAPSTQFPIVPFPYLLGGTAENFTTPLTLERKMPGPYPGPRWKPVGAQMNSTRASGPA
jgi:hypothetical protein